MWNMEDFNIIVQAWKESFQGIYGYFVLYLVFLVVFLVKRNKLARESFVYPFLFFLLVIYNPIILIPIAEKIHLLVRIRRIFWLMPVSLVVAWGMSQIVVKISRKWLRAIVALGIVVVIAALGVSSYPHLHKAENIYKISQEAIDVDEIIRQDAAQANEAYGQINDQPITIAYADVYLSEIRLYDTALESVLSRYYMLNWTPDFSDEEAMSRLLESGNGKKLLSLALRYNWMPQKSQMAACLKEAGVQYIIPQNALAQEDYWLSCGCEKVGATENYSVYKVIW